MAGIVCDSPVANCLEGNLFRFNSENSSGVVEGVVNGKNTGPLPHGHKVILENSREGTCNALDLVVNSRNYRLVDDLRDFTFREPNQVGVLLSEVVDEGPAAGTAILPDDVLLVAVPSGLAALSPGEMDLDLSIADDDILQWIAVSILTALEKIDERSGIDWFTSFTKGAVNLSMTGTDGPPLIADMIQILNSGNARQAIKVISRAGVEKIRIFFNGAGALMIALRVKSGLGKVLALGVASSMVRSRMANVALGVRGQFGASAAVQAGGRVPVIGFVIVGTIDVLEWYSDPLSRGDWSLLISTLFVDFGSLAIATLAGSGVVAGLVALLGGAAALTLGSAILVVAAGVGTGLAIGVGLSWLANKTGAISFVNSVLHAVGGALSALAQNAATVVSTFADKFGSIMEAIDEAIYSPVEMVQDAEKEFQRRLDQRIKAHIEQMIRIRR